MDSQEYSIQSTTVLILLELQNHWQFPIASPFLFEVVSIMNLTLSLLGLSLLHHQLPLCLLKLHAVQNARLLEPLPFGNLLRISQVLQAIAEGGDIIKIIMIFK